MTSEAQGITAGSPDADETELSENLFSFSVRTLRGDSAEKRELYRRALEGAAIDQKKIVDEYNEKFKYQG